MTLKITQAAREAAADCCPKELYELCGCYGSGVSGSSGFPCSDCGGSGGFPPDWLVQAFQRAMNQAADEALERADDAVEHVLAHVAGGGPHEWGYRDPVTGEFIADDWPFRAADALAAKDRTIERLREALEQISAEYENPNLSHKDFRVGTRLLADCALRAIAQEQSK